MKIFFKAQLSSLIATLVDFITTIFLVELCSLHYTLAACIGALFGAVTNFTVNRRWSFEATTDSARVQSLRYLIVWTGSMLLNVSGIYILTHFLNIKYILSKIIASLIIGLTFNYILQKQYVFIKNEKISS